MSGHLLKRNSGRHFTPSILTIQYKCAVISYKTSQMLTNCDARITKVYQTAETLRIGYNNEFIILTCVDLKFELAVFVSPVAVTKGCCLNVYILKVERRTEL